MVFIAVNIMGISILYVLCEILSELKEINEKLNS